ncbi:MAG: NAD-dependent epimerase/dehydratase family protein [Blastocatellia bacterium]|nr:NAD-dependent epimerase/dehydratase family protein [Blastocatellia bacterium]
MNSVLSPQSSVLSSLPIPSIAILGGGAVVTELYLPALRLLGWDRNLHIVDPAATLAKKFAGLPSITFHQQDFTSFLKSALVPGDFSFAVVALPNFLHEAAVSQALGKGLPVLCEKPLTLTEKSSAALAELARQTGKPLGVGMVRRFLPYITAMREALAGNLIGKLLSLDIQHGGPFAWASASGVFFQKESGGVLADMGVHYLDLAAYLAGPLRPVKYQDDARGGIEANSDFELMSETGVTVRIRLSRTHELENTIVLEGETGTLQAGVDVFDGCDWHSTQHPRLIARLAPAQPFHNPRWKPDFISCFAEQFHRFHQVAAGLAEPLVDAFQAAQTAGLIEWAYSNRAEGDLGVRAFPAAMGQTRPVLEPAPVVVTGGTGFIGTHLIERLTEIGLREMRVPVRNFQTCAEAARFPVKLIQTGLQDRDKLREVIRGCRFVFHLAYGRDRADSSAITIEGTKNIVEAAIAEGVETVVVLSTMYVFGHPVTETLVDETWPYAPAGGFYGETKVKMEKWCLNRAKSSGKTRIVVLNPSCVYGPGGRTYTLLPLHMAQAGTFGWIENGKGIANYTYVTNLVDSILQAATVPEAHGQRFLITDGFTTWKDFLSPLFGDRADSFGTWTMAELKSARPGRKTNVKDLARHLMNDYELLEIINGMPVLGPMKRQVFNLAPRFRSRLNDVRFETGPLAIVPDSEAGPVLRPPVWLGDLFGPTETRFSARKAQQILGWKPLIDLPAGQSQSLAWLREIQLI